MIVIFILVHDFGIGIKSSHPLDDNFSRFVFLVIQDYRLRSLINGARLRLSMLYASNAPFALRAPYVPTDHSPTAKSIGFN